MVLLVLTNLIRTLGLQQDDFRRGVLFAIAGCFA